MLLPVFATLARLLSGLAVVGWVLAAPSLADVASGEQPQALKVAHAFRGAISYVAYRVAAQPSGQPANAPIRGEVTISGAGWSVDERSPEHTLHVSSDGSWIRSGDRTLVFEDPFELGAIANAWAPVLARLALDAPAAPSGNAWLMGDGTRIYTSATGDITGIVDTPSGSISYMLGSWTNVDGLALPGDVLRLVDGAGDAAFRITDYHVAWAAASEAHNATQPASAATAVARPLSLASETSTLVWRRFSTLFVLLLIAVAAVAWLRRDALSERVCARLATDPRRWRGAGSSVFVTSDGVLLYDGHHYRVGAQFYNRITHVYTSALFLRVAAHGVSTSVVLPRRFGAPSIVRRTGPRQGMRPAGNGFSLVESLVASGLFSLVIVAVVFPTLIVLSQADRLAAVRQNAVRLAANTLVDEQAALAYGTIHDTQQTRRAGDLTVSVELKPAPLPGGAHVLAVAVADKDGRELVRLATLVGPPVPPPGSP